MAKRFRFGLIGCGGISQRHQEEIRKIEDAELVAVMDISEERAKSMAALTGAVAYTDYHAMLARDDIDIVSIVTPSGTHAEAIVACARAGKHVIVEKPVDVTLDKAQWAIEECRKAGVKLSVVAQHRFDDSTIRVKEAIETGRFGKLFLVQVTVDWYRAQSYYDRSGGSGTWAMDGGGVLMIQALHTIDLAVHLMGPLTSVYAGCLTATHERIEVEDVAVATMKFQSGALGTVSATTGAYPGLSTRLEIFGERGTAIIENDRLTHLYFRGVGEEEPMYGGKTANQADAGFVQPHDPGLAHRRQFQDTMDAIRNGREPLVNGEEGLRVMRAILAMYQSTQTDLPVRV